MWIFWNVVAMLFIAAAQLCNRHYGLSWESYGIYTFICVFITGWTLPLGYQLAPSLLHAWFLGIGVLAILGFLGSHFVFHDNISTHHYIGALITLIGSAILIKP
jgi:hypothetical protein